jgi:glycosyltransferase involved in cell wall biosynthesis
LIFVPGPDPAASFVAADRDLLAGETPVVELRPGTAAIERARFACALGARLLRHRPPLVVLWFASPTYGAITAALCRARAVPWVVVAGGAEVASRPAIGFGDARRRWRRRATAAVLGGAWRVWAFSRAAAAEIRGVAGRRPLALQIVPPVVDTTFFRPSGVPAPQFDDLPPPPAPLVLSACARLTAVTVRQKGIDRLVDVARRLPGMAIVVTGAIDAQDAQAARLRTEAPRNVHFVGFVSRERLRDLYARASVYLQLSDHEGFGVAVAEAVAMGATPVTTDLPALAEILGPRGRRVPRDAAPEQVAAVVGEALRARDRRPEAGWAEIDSRFGPAVRRAAWRALLEDAALAPPAGSGTP